MDSPTKVISAIFALSAFAVATIAGMAAGNPAHDILANSLVCMLLCYVTGGMLAGIALRVVRTHVEAHLQSNPIPDLRAAMAAASGDAAPAPQLPTNSSQPAQPDLNRA